MKIHWIPMCIEKRACISGVYTAEICLGGMGGASPILLPPKLLEVHPPPINPLYRTLRGKTKA